MQKYFTKEFSNLLHCCLALTDAELILSSFFRPFVAPRRDQHSVRAWIWVGQM